MTGDLDVRLAALDLDPGLADVGDSEDPTEVEGNYRFERRWRNGPVSEYGGSLVAAIEAAEWQEARIKDLPDRRTHVNDGLHSAGRTR